MLSVQSKSIQCLQEKKNCNVYVVKQTGNISHGHCKELVSPPEAQKGDLSILRSILILSK